MDGSQDQRLRDADIETIPPEPGVTAPLDHVREEEKAAEPVAVMPGSEADQDAREAPSAQERSGSTDAVDADTRDEPSMETSGTVDAVDATDPAAADADEVAADDEDDSDSDDLDGTDSGDEQDDAGDDASDDVDGTDTGDDAGDDQGDAD